MKCSTNRCRTSIFDELDRGLSQWIRGVSPTDLEPGSADPKLTVVEFGDRYEVLCDLPGVHPDDVSLELHEQTLSISGKRSASSPEETGRTVLSERTLAEFHRQITFDLDVDPAGIDAQLTSGVLRITVPRRAETLPRKIEIRRSGS